MLFLHLRERNVPIGLLNAYNARLIILFGLIYIKKHYAKHHSSNTDDLDSIYPTQDEIILKELEINQNKLIRTIYCVRYLSFDCLLVLN